MADSGLGCFAVSKLAINEGRRQLFHVLSIVYCLVATRLTVWVTIICLGRTVALNVKEEANGGRRVSSGT